MRRDNPLTFGGALKILGDHEPESIGRLDRLLGGVILAGGVAAALTPALAPLAVLAAAWGWVDQKNEAVKLARSAVEAVGAKLSAKHGHERVDLLAAAHTVIAVAAYFEALREALGEKGWAKLDLSTAEQLSLAAGTAQSRDFVTKLYTAEVPRPVAVHGFAERSIQIRDWMAKLNVRCMQFMRGLAGFENIDGKALAEVPGKGVKRYRSHYLKLAEHAPEFHIWASLGEHAATRETVRVLGADLHAAFAGQAGALARVESMLTLARTCPEPADLALVLHRANQRVLDEPIVDATAERHELPISFPTVADAYLNPRYRCAVYHSEASRPNDESWWKQLAVCDDLDLLLVDHVSGPEAQRLPLLLLGHPGAGKSLLTKVLAARLPASSYTVIRVPLRRVSANAPLHTQIQQALDLATNSRVTWPDLVEQTADTIRVVLLDGLDELLQATAHDRAGYLYDIAEFQRTEAAQLRPVIVVVTSRTVVADRVDIPVGTPVVRLDDFDQAQAITWIDRWCAANAAAIGSGRMGAISHEAALAQGVLARQPLLLLMLALYCADPQAPALDSDLSRAALYRRLIDNFALREVRKRADGSFGGERLRAAVDEQVRRLGIASLGMFNRGRQDITDRDLGGDLAALGEVPADHLTEAERGQRVLAGFYFVHTAEAQLLGGGETAAPQERSGGSTRRCHEFLHATFGEYLVADRLVDVLADVADGTVGRRRLHDPDDALLFALASHQTLATRQAVLEFARQLLSEAPADERDHIQRTLTTLLHGVRQRPDSTKHGSYQPIPPDRLRQMVTYSSNLVLLRLLLVPAGEGIPLASLFPHDHEPDTAWRAIVNLWRAGLDPGGWQSVLSTMHCFDSRLYLSGEHAGLPPQFADLSYARLLGDQRLEHRLRLGTALDDGFLYSLAPHEDAASLVQSLMLLGNMGTVVHDMAFSVGGTDVLTSNTWADMAMWQLIRCSRTWPQASVAMVATWLVGLGGSRTLLPYALAAAVCAHPELLAGELPLRSPHLYAEAPGAVVMIRSALVNRQYTTAERRLLNDLHTAVRLLLPDDPQLDTRQTSALLDVLMPQRDPFGLGRGGGLTIER